MSSVDLEPRQAAQNLIKVETRARLVPMGSDAYPNRLAYQDALREALAPAYISPYLQKTISV